MSIEKDIHSSTATEAKVSRVIAKSINFGKLYGTRDQPIPKHFECIKCYNIAEFKLYTDVECDGDIRGICPKCGKMTVMIEI